MGKVGTIGGVTTIGHKIFAIKKHFYSWALTHNLSQVGAKNLYTEATLGTNQNVKTLKQLRFIVLMK